MEKLNCAVAIKNGVRYRIRRKEVNYVSVIVEDRIVGG